MVAPLLICKLLEQLKDNNIKLVQEKIFLFIKNSLHELQIYYFLYVLHFLLALENIYTEIVKINVL